jgi:leader peptidase (prepilin peptidase)/N-methyltransferase
MIRQHHHLIPNILHFLTGGLMGLVAASLTHHLGWRSADRMPGESRYPNCSFCLKPLRWQEIFPLFSWLLRPDTLSFSCPCGLRQGLWAQPLTEVIAFMLGVVGMYLVGWTSLSIPLCLGLGILCAIAMIDLHFGVIPDELNFLIALSGLSWVIMGGGDIYQSLIVSALMLMLGLFCALIYSRWRGQEMLGLGDVKFFAAAGIWLEPQMAPWFLALAGLIGAIVGITWQKLGGGKESPFAPALCLSLAICVLYQITQMP